MADVSGLPLIVMQPDQEPPLVYHPSLSG